MKQLNEINIRTDIRAGDLGMITYLHGVLYESEYQYGISFESIVAGGLHEFYSTYNPSNERLWVAEDEGRMAGCILLKSRGDYAQLRYFLVMPEYRGIGLGNELVRLFLKFAKACGYKGAYLWTTSELDKALHLYRKSGFVISEEKPSAAFGKAVIEQRYDLVF